MEFLCAGAEETVSVAGSWGSWRPQQLNRSANFSWQVVFCEDIKGGEVVGL